MKKGHDAFVIPSIAPTRPEPGGGSLASFSSHRLLPSPWSRFDRLALFDAEVTSGQVSPLLGTPSDLLGPSGLVGFGWFCSTDRLASSPTARAPRRQRELQWLQSNRKELQGFAGEWIVLDGERIIAHGRNAAEVVREARSKGVHVPFLHRVEGKRPKGVVRIGL